MTTISTSRQCIGLTRSGLRCRHYTSNPNGWCGQCIAPTTLGLADPDAPTPTVVLEDDYLETPEDCAAPPTLAHAAPSAPQPGAAPPLSVSTPLGRCYHLPPDEETLYPSVTTICRLAAGDTSGLDAWRTRVTAQVAVLHADELAQLPDDKARAQAITKLAQEATRAAAERGTRIHAALAAWVNGEPLPELASADTLDFDAARRWIANNVRLILGAEQTVFCTKGVPYAGTADLRCVLNNGETAIIDYKTGSYTDDRAFAMQLAAYANADLVVDPDGSRHPAPPTDRLIVLQASDGTVSPHDYTHCRKEALQLFESLAASAGAIAATPNAHFKHHFVRVQ